MKLKEKIDNKINYNKAGMIFQLILFGMKTKNHKVFLRK